MQLRLGNEESLFKAHVDGAQIERGRGSRVQGERRTTRALPFLIVSISFQDAVPVLLPRPLKNAGCHTRSYPALPLNFELSTSAFVPPRPVRTVYPSISIYKRNIISYHGNPCSRRFHPVSSLASPGKSRLPPYLTHLLYFL